MPNYYNKRGCRDETTKTKVNMTVCGCRGPQGYLGSFGPTGPTGSQGPVGGATGVQGAAGTPGAAGLQGGQGSQGAQGAQGAGGAQGFQGSAGIGTQGFQGVAGSAGPPGSFDDGTGPFIIRYRANPYSDSPAFGVGFAIIRSGNINNVTVTEDISFGTVTDGTLYTVNIPDDDDLFHVSLVGRLVDVLHANVEIRLIWSGGATNMYQIGGNNPAANNFANFMFAPTISVSLHGNAVAPNFTNSATNGAFLDNMTGSSPIYRVFMFSANELRIRIGLLSQSWFMINLSF